MVPRQVFTVPAGGRALARVPVLPVGDASDPGSLLAEGMFLASRQADAAARGSLSAGRRLAATLRGYEIRARSRPTPNGVFAGVALAGFGKPASLVLGTGHQARTYPSSGWLAAVCAMALEDPAVLPLLVLHASNLAVHRGQRIEQEHPAVPGQVGPQRVSVRATEAVHLIMRECADGATLAQLRQQISGRWPAVPAAKVNAAVLELIAGGFLLTSLLPADVTADPAGHLLAVLPPASRLRGPIERLRACLTEADRHPPGYPARLAALRAARDAADEICWQDRPLAADVTMCARLVLPRDLARDAAAAASTLWRISRARDPLASWHDRFLGRYGPDRLVPLLDAADPVLGIGTVAEPDSEDSDRLPPRRAAILGALLARAAASGAAEVLLGPADIAALSSDADTPPRTAEIYARVIADSEQDLTAGRLRLAISPAAGSQDAWSTAGRFSTLLPAPERDSDPAGLVAELVIQPRTSQAAALAPPTGFAPARIPVGVTTADGDISLADLLLSSDGQRLTAWSASRRCPVIPVLYSRLAPLLIPPLARLLQLVGHSGSRPWHGWSWGPLGHGPFQPRVRYGRTILAAARWVLPASLADAAARPGDWAEHLDGWRSSAIPAPPDVVVTDDGDRQLPLDLCEPGDRELLRRYVRRGLRAVTEQPGGSSAIRDVVRGPGGRHALEVVFPLACLPVFTAATRLVPLPARVPGDGLHLPGGQWLSAAVLAPASCQDEVLLSLADLTAELSGLWDRWFWLRYSDPARGPLIRVRFHGNPSELGGAVLPALSRWCSGLMRQRLSGGLLVEPYDQEIERYGGPGAIGAAEQVFTADSHLVLTLLASKTGPGERIIAAALSAAGIAAALADGESSFLRGHHLSRAGREQVTTLRKRTRSYATDPGAFLLDAAATAWADRRAALQTYRDTLDAGHRCDAASAVIHMHANRLLGSIEAEGAARTLARDLLATTRLPA